MPIVEFSPVQLDYMVRTAYGGLSFGIWGTQTTGSTASSTLLGNNSVKLTLFSGAIPAQPRLMSAANFSSALVFWLPYSENTSEIVTNPYTVTTTYKTAIATGTATWFALAWYNATPPATNGTLIQRIIGTVGTIGSGEDLELVNTNIVTGSQYRVYNFRIALPSSYTY